MAGNQTCKQAVDHKSDALTTTLPTYQATKYQFINKILVVHIDTIPNTHKHTNSLYSQLPKWIIYKWKIYLNSLTVAFFTSLDDTVTTVLFIRHLHQYWQHSLLW